MNRKWFIHCLSVVLFFIERSVIFGNHIVEQRNKQKKETCPKNWKHLLAKCATKCQYYLPWCTVVQTMQQFFPRFFFVGSSSLLGLWLLFFMQEQLIRRAYIEKWSNKVKNRFSKRHESCPEFQHSTFKTLHIIYTQTIHVCVG